MALELSADVFQRTSCCLSRCGEFGADYKEKPLISQEISGFSLFSELFEDVFLQGVRADPNADPYGSESGF